MSSEQGDIADTHDEGSRKRKAEEEEQGDTEGKEKKKPKDDAAEEEGNQDEEEFEELKEFPQNGPRRYLLQRAFGMDVLQDVREDNMEGVLEIEEGGKNSIFWVEFPGGKGVIAGRLECVGPMEGDPTTYFRATCCKAFVDYGLSSGVIRRDGETPGVGFMGMTATFGQYAAQAGSEDFSSENPLAIDLVYSIECLVDESDPTESEKDDLPESFRPVKKGCIQFVLFIEDGISSYASGRDAPVPVNLLFRPQAMDESSSIRIPSDIRKDILKLPSIRETHRR